MRSSLENPVLILNKGWLPIGAYTAKDAISDTYTCKTKIVCPETYQVYDIFGWMKLPVIDGENVIRGPFYGIKTPEVVVSHYNKIPVRKVIFSRRNLWKRDLQQCQYCGKLPRADEITIDHVIPKTQGGQTKFDNCVLACVECNKQKRGRTPEQSGMRLRKTILLPDKNTRVEFYHRPKNPTWNPIYSMKRHHKFPRSWSKFLQRMIDELYWGTELEP